VNNYTEKQEAEYRRQMELQRVAIGPNRVDGVAHAYVGMPHGGTGGAGGAVSSAQQSDLYVRYMELESELAACRASERDMRDQLLLVQGGQTALERVLKKDFAAHVVEHVMGMKPPNVETSVEFFRQVFEEIGIKPQIDDELLALIRAHVEPKVGAVDEAVLQERIRCARIAADTPEDEVLEGIWSGAPFKRRDVSDV